MQSQPIFLYNTLGNEKQEFSSLKPHEVRMYNCGPTVYDNQHIGNLSNAVFTDILRRTLEYNGYTVHQVMNFTDFGHLTSDADDGDDKMTVGLKREGLELTLENMHKLASTYIQHYLDDLKQLNVRTVNTQFPRASEYVHAQIALIETLELKGYAYETSDGVYFDTTRFPSYGMLGGQSKTQQEDGVRVAENPEKHNPKDFALWKKNSEIGWDSPWGKGFPGWHIECSAMARSCLGKQIDIHTGGIEHIGVHHNNEIAQSEAATGKSPFSKFWLHRAHIQIEGRKISKSIGNTIYLRQIIDRGFSPLSYRYWLLTAHYRTPANFTWDALEGAHTALKKLHRQFVDELTQSGGSINTHYEEVFHDHINDDLNTPKAIALVWELLKDDSVSPADKRATLLHFDTVLGLGLIRTNESIDALLSGSAKKISLSDTPEYIQKLVALREEARKKKNFADSDTLRDELIEAGYAVEDTADGPILTKIQQEK